LVIFTGDVVTEAPAKNGWDVVTEAVSKRGIPFAVTLGNHDDEQDLSRAQVARLVASYPKSLFKDTTDNVSGYGNYTLPIKSAAGNKTAAVLYCMDSRSYSKIKAVEGYGWFSQDQVNWYRNQSADFTKQNGGKPLPALAFFHIALPEYNKAYNTRAIGLRFEDECNPKVNSGMFTAMLESGDVMGTFVGHDHDNDYIAWLDGIALVYGRFTGGKTTYINIENGARVITLQEGEAAFKSWIRLRGNRIIQQTEFPKTFIKK
ncbi:MAG: metallophosphoesterase family protein, partial [Parabacteroides sp.]|nr:metallophosphoesterase family protein [Parabacteroides sp.]